MRILLLHSSSDLYGASKIFLQTVTLLRKHGHQCVVVLSNKGSLEEALELVGAEVHIINLGISVVSILILLVFLTVYKNGALLLLY